MSLQTGGSVCQRRKRGATVFPMPIPTRFADFLRERSSDDQRAGNDSNLIL
jgi:hypothetical protein